MIKYTQSNLLCTNVFARNAASMLGMYFGTKRTTINDVAINFFEQSFLPERQFFKNSNLRTQKKRGWLIKALG